MNFFHPRLSRLRARISSLGEKLLQPGSDLHGVMLTIGPNDRPQVEIHVSNDHLEDARTTVAHYLDVPFDDVRLVPSLRCTPQIGVSPTEFAAHKAAARRGRFGTVGGYVRHKNGTVMAVSCNHVFAELNRAQKGDELVVRRGPGKLEMFASLFDFHRLELYPGRSVADAAIGKPRGTVPEDRVFSRFALAESTTLVRKLGASSRETTGYVTGVGTMSVRYEGFGDVVYTECLRIHGADGAPFSLPGDSGSFVTTEDRSKVVGIVFAGGEKDRPGSYSLANPARELASALGLQLTA